MRLPAPQLLYDGHCPFCTGWAYRLQRWTHGRLRIEPNQNVSARFPEVSARQWQAAVALVDADGRLHWGADAVCQALALIAGLGWLPRAYAELPGGAALAERAYRWAAKRRRRTLSDCEACGR